MVELPFDLVLTVLGATLIASLGAALLDEVSLQAARTDATSAIERLQSALLRLDAAGPLGATVTTFEGGGNGVHRATDLWVGCSPKVEAGHPNCSGAYVALDSGSAHYAPFHDADGEPVLLHWGDAMDVERSGPATGMVHLSPAHLRLTLERQVATEEGGPRLTVLLRVAA